MENISLKQEEQVKDKMFVIKFQTPYNALTPNLKICMKFQNFDCVAEGYSLKMFFLF